ncbi:hypothetical protein [Streptomyces sp. NPDC059788]|uniref:hypothetical protein n=1 Tax=Streptomyces sp. NPDC059788 TaxID=3346948 RepID=UPI00365BA74C
MLPHLLRAAEASRLLLLEYLPDAADWTADTAAALAGAAAAVHAAPAMFDPAPAGALANFRLDGLAAASASAWIGDPGARHTAVSLCVDVHGPHPSSSATSASSPNTSATAAASALCA